jgi:hypothetical protein
MPGDICAPIVTDHDRATLVEGGYERDHVADEVEDRVGLDRGRRARFAIAAHIRRDDAVSRRGEKGNLSAPGIRELRPAVTKEHERPDALFDDSHVEVIDFDASSLGGHGAGLFPRNIVVTFAAASRVG